MTDLEDDNALFVDNVDEEMIDEGVANGKRIGTEEGPSCFGPAVNDLA